MTPVICQTKHNPPESYGDCLRAVVASLLDLTPPEVPHFADRDADDAAVKREMRRFLRSRGYYPVWITVDGRSTFDEICAWMYANNPGVYYLLFGRNESGESHVVVCLNDGKAHDPAWYPTRMVGPASNDHWTICIFVSERMVA